MNQLSQGAAILITGATGGIGFEIDTAGCRVKRRRGRPRLRASRPASMS
jgi:hypothetical protein